MKLGLIIVTLVTLISWFSMVNNNKRVGGQFGRSTTSQKTERKRYKKVVY
jgi:hypothetical protein